jgi:glycosyltransferase involved in cell wall biosynthesis
VSRRRIRVLQVITSLAGGAGFYAYNLTRHLDPVRFDVTLAFGPGYPLDKLVAREGLPHLLLSWNRRLDPLASLKGAWDLATVLRDGSYDIVHAHCSLAGAISRIVARWCAVPRVLFSMHTFASRDYQPRWRQLLYLQMERFLDRYTDLYFANTQAIKNLAVAKQITCPGRIHVIAPGIELPAAPDTLARARARDVLGLSSTELAVAMAGRLEEQKGLVYLLRAFARVRPEVPGARLLIFGDGPLREQLVAEAMRLGISPAVRFLGWRADLDSLLPGCDLFCLPSLWESFGYVLLEAMAAGLPIVTTRVEGIPEVTGDGDCALLVPPTDDVALACALCLLLRNSAERAAMARRGRERVEHEFTLSNMIRQFETCYERLIYESNSGA